MAITVKTLKHENEPYVLPKETKELQRFITKYKVDMTEHAVSSIEFAIKHKLPIVEIFQFKDSKFVVTVCPKEFESNLDTIYKFYLENEHYELCKRVVKLREKLTKGVNEKRKKSTPRHQ